MKNSFVTVSKTAVGACIVSALVACGGGSSDPAVAVVVPAPQLSADQTIFESLNLAPSAAYLLVWSLPNAGLPVSGTNYLLSSNASHTLSPLTNGPQTVTNSAYVSMATTLAVPAGIPVNRYVVNGQILVGSLPSKSVATYQGTGVKIDTLASDGVTKVQSQVRSGYTSVSLTGLVKDAPADLAQNFNSLFFNPALLRPTGSWASGAAYIKYTATNNGDVYQVFDNSGVTYSATPVPVASGTTIAALMGTSGIVSATDAATYTLTNGSVSVINGVKTYVATAVRPNSTTVAYRSYYELNGNVYTGQLIKDGAVFGGSPYFTPVAGSVNAAVNYSSKFQIRLNKEATNSLQSAFAF